MPGAGGQEPGTEGEGRVGGAGDPVRQGPAHRGVQGSQPEGPQQLGTGPLGSRAACQFGAIFVLGSGRTRGPPASHCLFLYSSPLFFCPCLLLPVLDFVPHPPRLHPPWECSALALTPRPQQGAKAHWELRAGGARSPGLKFQISGFLQVPWAEWTDHGTEQRCQARKPCRKTMQMKT